MRLEVDANGYSQEGRGPLFKAPFTTDVVLSDGGVYDNLGLEPVWRDHETVLVSDAAPSFKPDPDVGWLWGALRQGVILLEQATEVRKRWLVSNFIADELKGAYWGIASRPESYELDTPPTI